MTSAIITLTTDFGLADGYVAAMKGVILGINPEAALVDVCHTIEPQNILQAAFVLSTVHEFFPPGTIHLVVVDPGVGTQRRAIILRISSAYFAAPDNGVLSYVLPAASFERINDRLVKLGAGVEAITIANPRFWRSPVSATFHGRDIFAPVTAWLSLGFSPSQFGEKTDSIIALPMLEPHWTRDGVLMGRILHIDRFGNLITNVKSDDLPAQESIIIDINGRTIRGLVHTYAEGEGLIALIGSSGYLEIALKDGSASALLWVKIGSEVKFAPVTSSTGES